jgi:hypothetical protein
MLFTGSKRREIITAKTPGSQKLNWGTGKAEIRFLNSRPLIF